jgi:hypothetical protein
VALDAEWDQYLGENNHRRQGNQQQPKNKFPIQIGQHETTKPGSCHD